MSNRTDEETREQNNQPKYRRIPWRLDPLFSKISLYVIGTAFIIYILYRILDNLPLFLTTVGRGINWLGIVLKPLFIGFAFAYLLYPLTGFLERQIDKLKDRIPLKRKRRSSRALATLFTWLIILAVLVTLLSTVISTMTKEIRIVSFSDIDSLSYAFANTLNSFSETLQSYLVELNLPSAGVSDFIQEVGNLVSGWAQNFARNILTGLRNVTSLIAQLLFAVIFAIYFLLDGDGIRRYWSRAFCAFTPEKVQNGVTGFLREADIVFAGYIRGQMLDALFIATVVSIGLSVIGVRYAIIIGVLTGIGNLIPYVGPFVAYISTIVVSLLDWNPRRFIVAILFLFIIQTVDGNVVNPRLLSKNVNMHPVLVIVSLIIGGAVGGFFGMLVAVPIGALIKVYFEKIVDYRLKKQDLVKDDETAGK